MEHGPGFAWPFFVLVPIFWVLVIGLIVTLILILNRRRWRESGPAGGSTHSAEATLAERFARGDIDEQDYRARLEVLRAARPDSRR
ncbi:putative membrane protein [Brevibacterium sanguinis]|uniref:Membrane protein n=2 Tax=Brevibacterium TaxID=1696 RepID=A0ABX9GRC7_9MICO|nr:MULTISPECIES: hypothetical protein [Brevibacterium]RBP63444.1 putative membrane protein [Brevibacterium sanguinis]RBP69911.1 putative membrane protein [Brevibacterium celere]